MRLNVDRLLGQEWEPIINSYAALGSRYIEDFNRDEFPKPLSWLLAAVWLRQAVIHAKVAASICNTLPHATCSQARILLEISASLRFAFGDDKPTEPKHQEQVAKCYVIASLLRDKAEILDGLRGALPQDEVHAHLAMIERQLNNPAWDDALSYFTRQSGPNIGKILYKDWHVAMSVDSFKALLDDDSERMVYSQTCGGIHSSDMVANVFGAGPRKVLSIAEAPPLPQLFRASILSSLERCCRIVFRSFPLPSHPFSEHCMVLTTAAVNRAR